MKYATLSALALAGLTAIAVPGAPAQPSPDELPVPLGPARQPSPPKSDEHRIVGTVLRIDLDKGLATLSTDEGVLVVEPPRQTLRAIRVGDTVSVPREPAHPSASPRE